MLERGAVYFPLSAVAASQLRAGSSPDTAAVQVVAPDAGDLLHLWKGGLIDRINRQAECFIDEYEEEEIGVDKLAAVLQVLDAWLRENEGTITLLPLVQDLRDATEAAITRGTPALFVF